MIVRLVLEQKQPWLLLSVHLHVHLHRAGVDFFRLIQFVQSARAAQVFCGKGCNVHQVDRLGSAHFLTGLQIILIRIL